MNKASKIWRLFGFCLLITQTTLSYSVEMLLDADVAARVEHNDNIFLVSDPEDSVTGIIITPSLSGIIRERNWETRLHASLGIQKYSDHDLDSNDQFFDLSGRYQAQRNIFSLNISHNLTSSLSTVSDDFGLSRTRIKRKTQSISPTYTRLITERLSSSFSYIYSDVDFIDAEGTNFTPYITQTGVVSLQYALTEKDDLSFILQAVDYESKNKLVTYQLFTTNIGIDHSFSRTLSSNFQIGVSRQSTTSLRTVTEDFFGGIIILTREIDAKNRGLVFNIGLTQILETGSINANISRNDTTNSFGGLNVTNAIALNYTKRLSELWQYDINGRYSDITSISSGSSSTDRDIFSFEAIARYSISAHWEFSASYRYLLRKFKSDTSSNAPHSNRIFVGLSYNFPSLSTF